MTTIILTRHGHVDGIEPPRFRGRQPLPLSKRGLVEAERTAQRIASAWRPAAIYTSTLERCLATGAAIGRACSVEPAAISDLDDLDYGDWQWRTFEEVEQRWPQLYEQWFSAPEFIRFPNGESLQDIVLRSANALRRAVDLFPADAVVLVGHESVNRALLLQLLGQPLSAYWRIEQGPCAINVLEVDRRSVRAIAVNDTGHLRNSA